MWIALLQVEKAERREVTVAVAVVQLVPQGGDAAAVIDANFLLVQRPKDGLLAGKWRAVGSTRCGCCKLLMGTDVAR